MTSRVRLVCIARDTHGGGAERVQLALLGSLDRSRFEITLVYLNDRKFNQALVPGGIKTLLLRTSGRPLSILGGLKGFYQAARGADLIFGLQDLTPIYLAAAAGLTANRPTLGWIHNTWSQRRATVAGWHGLATRLIYPRVDKLICVSAGVESDLLSVLPHLAGHTLVLPNALDLSRIRALAAAPLPEWAERLYAESPVFLGVGRLTRAKRFDLLIDAFAAMKHRGSTHLVILGEGPERAVLQGQIDRGGLRDRILLPGNAENPYPFFSKSLAFVLSSDFEGLPTVIIEALSLGTPVISTRCPSGPAELLREGSNGLLVPPGDRHAMANALDRMAQDAGLRGQLRRAGPVRAAEFDAPAAAKRFEEAFLSAAYGATSA